MFVTRDGLEATGRLAHLLCSGKLKTFHFEENRKRLVSAKWWRTSTTVDTRQDIFTNGALKEIVVSEGDLAAILPPPNNSAPSVPTQRSPAIKNPAVQTNSIGM